jgi:hypothetical protein
MGRNEMNNVVGIVFAVLAGIAFLGLLWFVFKSFRKGDQ